MLDQQSISDEDRIDSTVLDTSIATSRMKRATYKQPTNSVSMLDISESDERFVLYVQHIV